MSFINNINISNIYFYAIVKYYFYHMIAIINYYRSCNNHNDQYSLLASFNTGYQGGFTKDNTPTTILGKINGFLVL